MIKSFEPVYKELEEMFIKNLPDYIEKINKQYNDGIILKRFENSKLDEECIKFPCFKFLIKESEYSEKDRIIENTIFNITLEIRLHKYVNHKLILLNRYFEAIQKMIEEFETYIIYQFLELKENSINLKIIL